MGWEEVAGKARNEIRGLRLIFGLTLRGDRSKRLLTYRRRHTCRELSIYFSSLIFELGILNWDFRKGSLAAAAVGPPRRGEGD